MAQLNLNKAEFVKSAASPEAFIRDSLPRIVFAGKSNVGKSSVINRLLNRKNFARVGAQPGKTVHVNYFKIDGRCWFVDLPGYGYAAVAKAERDRWARLMESFFAEPEQISLGVMIVDARHKPTADDMTMCEWFKGSGRPFVVAANKCDKLSKTAAAANLAMIRAALGLAEDTLLLAFSAEKGEGRAELLSRILEQV
ncbi:MAG TPA: YihA family ribosome biogenesis GTP-binding protein [Candidatus Scatomorpha pullistercoris]|uniref:Probable GTP-binding protein EngB n=1 Tax=Candidatus Scatomorpha pullistercoris TaxID=2840929 RepID=A0A9D1K896_9FIRM|nr:YihA family ribosome biogenesis GTP-binding protein [Candidatus Scatomorpha pullistercoris]